MNRTVRVFRTKHSALEALRRLKDAGVEEREISVLLKDIEWIHPLVKRRIESPVENPPISDNTSDAECSTAEFFLAMEAIVAPLGGPLLAAGHLPEVIRNCASGRSFEVKEVLGYYEFDEDHKDYYLEHLEKGYVMVLVEENKILMEKAVLSLFEQDPDLARK